MEKSQATTLMGLRIWVELGVLLVEEKHVVSRQPPCPQVAVEVDCIPSVVVCSFYLQKKTDVQTYIHII